MKCEYQPVSLPNEFPGGFFVCSLKEPRKILFANAEVLRLFDCRDFGELSIHLQDNVENMLAVEDVRRVHSQMEHQLAEKGSRFDHVFTRIITRRGRTRYVDLSGCLVHSLEEGDLLYCLMVETGNRSSDYQMDEDIREYVIDHIDTALSRGWIHLYYQPVIRTLTGELCGFEVLSRWIDPKIGFLSPGMFIPALEQTRQIHKLDTYILKETCRTIRSRMDKGLPTVPVSFNLSRVDFMLLDVFDMIESTMAAFNLPRDLLHIEITESIVAEDPGHIRATMDRLREEGYEVWIDDFGSGYSSLNLLKDVNCDLIKLDMGFLRTFTEKSRQIIASTISMAKKLGIKTLMEGVETSEQADFLASIGCGRLQGFFFGKPQPLSGAFAHIEARQAGIETRRWHHYYDTADGLIYATDEPLAVMDFMEDTFHYLYTNRAYREQLSGIGFTMETIKGALNSNENSSLYRDMRRLLETARETGKDEVYFCTISSNYIRIRLQVILQTDGHTLLRTSAWNITQDANHMEHAKFDTYLRYLYMIFDSLCIVDFAADTIEQLFESSSSATNNKHEVLHGVHKMLAKYEDTIVYPADREQYHRYADPADILQRLAACPDGLLSCCVRLKDIQGNYNWALCSALLIPEGGGQRMLTIIQALDKDTGNLPALMRSISDSEEVRNAPKTAVPMRLTANYQSMLWENQMKHSEFCYFWKDRERRFLGVSRSFLAYYGFDSVGDVLGRTDEDMGWHIEEGPYRDAELAVLDKGITVRNQPGQCIIRGVLHHITCYKWPLYDRGQIVGLMGVFFDADKMKKRIQAITDTSYVDSVTGLMNTRGWFDALFTYDEQKTLQKRRYSVLLLDNSTYRSVVEAYGADFARQLLREEADTLRKTVGRDSTIARIRESTFAVLSYEKTEAEAEERVQVILRSLQTIHKVGGSPVTLAYHYAIAHSTEKGVSAENIYHVAQTRLQDAPEKTGTKRR